jgi:MFS family permease
MVLPLLVVLYIYALPESPRVLLAKARRGGPRANDLYEKAFLALKDLRNSKVQAARDLFLMDHLLGEEASIMHEQRRFVELFTVGRCRRALTASVICMFLQQMCGVNVTVYYSSKTMRDDAGWSNNESLLLSAGFGIINFLFAFPAVWTIDTFGRRNLLLFTFPFMALFQFVTAIAVALPKGDAQRALAIVGMYLFGIAYSPGEGPVPFVYSAESMPLYNRDYGMGIVTAINWLFNFIVSFTWPSMKDSKDGMGPSGAFAWYGVWCLIGWWLILLFVPETKDLTLEELDQVFETSTRDYIKHGLAQLRWFISYYILRRTWLRNRRPIFLRPVEPRRRYDPRGDQEME